MRLVTYEREGSRRLGAWVEASVVDLPDAVGHPVFPATMEALVARNGGTTMEAARAALAYRGVVDECGVFPVQLLAPVVPARPRGHRSTAPLLLGPDERLTVAGSGPVRFIPRVACVVGRAGRDLTEAQAARVVFGYTLTVSWSLIRGGRAVPLAVSQGPLIATPDELDPSDLVPALAVDGELVWRGSFPGSHAGFAARVARASRGNGVRPGQVIGVPLWGARASGPELTEPDWEMEVEVAADGLGVLRTWFRRS